jgi:hypothetical protein
VHSRGRRRPRLRSEEGDPESLRHRLNRSAASLRCRCARTADLPC